MTTELSRLPKNDLLLTEISTKYATYKMVHLLIKIMSTDFTNRRILFQF